MPGARSQAPPTTDNARRNLNPQVAARLREAADLLELQDANAFRVAAYRKAADTVDGLGEDVATIARREGAEGLTRLPAIGRGIASAILEMGATGRWARLDRLRGEMDPVRRLQCVPGIGPALAVRIHDALDIESLEDLEAAAHDGRLAGVPGIGRRRLAQLQATLDGMLRRLRPRRAHRPEVPDVPTLLEVDREYRERAAAGELPTIAPKRFNPGHERWLPILHTDRADWHFTALFSNTARAHELGRTRDWVVIYCYDGEHQESQCTVVTETRGDLAGRRVVRGREKECLEYHRATHGRRGART